MPVWVNSVISGLTLAVVTALAGYCKQSFAAQRREFEALKESQRNQLKASIVRSYDEARRQGFITAAELDTMHRRAESYWQLGGNSYIHAIMSHADTMEVRGELPRG
jgi:bisphosphoglycerate-dependent phosphoglycerate mutase